MKFKQFEINLEGKAAILLTEFQFTITLFNIGNPSLFIDSLSYYAILLFSAVFILATGKCKVRGSKGWSSQNEVNKKCMLHMQNSFIFSHVIRVNESDQRTFSSQWRATDRKVMPMRFFFFFGVFIFQQFVSLEWRYPKRNLPLHCCLITKKIDTNLNLQLFAVCC